jgi:hypothetical protein
MYAANWAVYAKGIHLGHMPMARHVNARELTPRKKAGVGQSPVGG